MREPLRALCAGASEALVTLIAAQFTAATGVPVQSRFGAVGAMRDALRDGERCDVMILSDALMTELAQTGEIEGRSLAPLGAVSTGIAVRSASPLPDISDPERFTAALLAADGLYLPDPERATAGIHLTSVLRRLNVFASCEPHLLSFPNGATAMRALAAAGPRAALGCAQSTEIVRTPGVTLVGGLPAPFELDTVYTAGVTRNGYDPDLCARFVDLLCGPQARSLRADQGFGEH